MLSMSINHPDIEEFITKKQDLTKVTGANISVKVTDEFMQAVVNDKDYVLRYPVNSNITEITVPQDFKYNTLYKFHISFPSNRTGSEMKDDVGSYIYIKRVKARELWDTLIRCAHNTAEPGIIFEDAMHNYSPDGVYPEFKMVSTNPCSEIGMGPFDSCRLIHLNLASYILNPFTDKANIDSTLLYKHSYEAMRLADDLIDLEVEAIDRIIKVVENDSNDIELELWNKIKKRTIEGRRAGLGFTGLADAIAMLGLKYDSCEGHSQAKYLTEIIFNGQVDSEIDMAIERGAFPAWNGGLEGGNISKSGSWHNWMYLSYPKKCKRMLQYGRRNINFSTVAPVGTVSIMAGTSSGIEPVFMPFYQRKRKCMSESDRIDYIDKVGEKYTLFTVVHPNLKRWVLTNKLRNAASPIIKHMLPEEVVPGNLEWYIDENWTLKDWERAYKYSPYYGSTASEIDWNGRVHLQGIIQNYITHSISSTVNLPKGTTQDVVSDLYFRAWKEGLKGITVYIEGSREGILNEVGGSTINVGSNAPKRPKKLEADCYLMKVKGSQFIVLVGLLNGKPYEVFVFRPINLVNFKPHKGTITKVSKMHYDFESEVFYIKDIGASNTSLEETAATLYSSMLLRHGVPIKYITKTIKKVNDNISSFSSALCRVLNKYVTSEEIRDEMCPNCGDSLIRENGCVHCISCGWSKCE